MALEKFRAFQLAKELYQETQKLNLRIHERDQLERAAMSVATNLAEGSGKSGKDRRRFFSIAMGSLREAQALLELTNQPATVKSKADQLGAMIFQLQKNPGPGH